MLEYQFVFPDLENPEFLSDIVKAINQRSAYFKIIKKFPLLKSFSEKLITDFIGIVIRA